VPNIEVAPEATPTGFLVDSAIHFKQRNRPKPVVNLAGKPKTIWSKFDPDLGLGTGAGAGRFE
jgi:hypothetical protein